MAIHNGKCFCGAVELKVTGEPEAMGYCHCGSCRSWSASPVNAFSLWKPEAVTFTKGESNVGVYHQTERSYRKWCKTCGGHLAHWIRIDQLHMITQRLRSMGRRVADDARRRREARRGAVQQSSLTSAR